MAIAYDGVLKGIFESIIQSLTRFSKFGLVDIVVSDSIFGIVCYVDIRKLKDGFYGFSKMFSAVLGNGRKDIP